MLEKKRTIDAHHHMWRYSAAEYEWIDGPLVEIRRDYLPADLQRELKVSNVDGTVVVQARQHEDETEWLLSCARETPQILGVVGWANIAAADFPQRLQALAQQPKMVGLRHWVQAEPDGFLEQQEFNRGIRALRDADLVYDILIVERQLEEAACFVDRHPEQPFVLDHMAKPKIAAGEVEPWRQRIVELSRRPNVRCKVSGMVTEANPKNWKPTDLRPYLDTVVEAFGPQRLMAGSDWPVCLVGTSYQSWWDLLHSYFAEFSEAERASIFGGCAARTYGLKVD